MPSNSDIPFVFVSEYLGRKVADRQGRILGLLEDLVATTGEPYPPVTGLLVRLRSGERRIAPLRVAELPTGGRRRPIAVDPEEMREAQLGGSDFLVRELLLDQQIVDMRGAKVERVNDVQLLLTDRLWIVHVDVGFTGLIRRLGFTWLAEGLRRLLRRPLKEELISWKYVQPLAESEEPGKAIRLKVERAHIHELHPGEMADILEDLGKEEREMIVRSLGPEAAADALEEAEEEVQAAVISQLDPGVAADILEEMDPGEAADILTSIPDAHSEEIMEEVEAPERAQLEQLIAYEEKTAAGLMTPEFVAVGPEATVAECLEEVRRQASEIEGIYYVYVLEAGRLIGVTTLRTLFRSPPEGKVQAVMETRLVTVLPSAEPKEVAEAFQKYSFLGCPVVDEDGLMLGVILIKHAFDELLPEFRREGRA